MFCQDKTLLQILVEKIRIPGMTQEQHTQFCVINVDLLDIVLNGTLFRLEFFVHCFH